MKGTPGGNGPKDGSTGDTNKTRQAVASAFNAVSSAIWVVRNSLDVEFANAAAVNLATAGALVKVTAGKLTRLGHLTGDTLRQAAARPEALGRHTLTVVINQGDRHHQRAILHLTPVPALPGLAAAWPAAHRLLSLEVPSLVDESPWLAFVVHRWGLTEAQGHTLADLASGYTVEGIAAKRAIKVGTVRAHLHELFKKTGMRRQVDLVRLAFGEWHEEPYAGVPMRTSP